MSIRTHLSIGENLKKIVHSLRRKRTDNKTFISVITVIMAIFIAIGLWIAFGPRYALYNQVSRQQVSDFWSLQSKLYVDPQYLLHQLNKEEREIVLVDIRSAEEYKKAHILDAVSIPVSFDMEKSVIKSSSDVERAFKNLGRKQEIIIYGENSYSQLPEKVAFELSSKGIPVQILTVGFNEFRHFSTFWLPESLWGKVRVEDYITGESVQ